MKRDLAERLLSQILKWETKEKAEERALLEAFAAYKYDEYQQFGPGRRFLESLALWLRQFNSLDERRDAYEFVKKKLVFISDAEINHLVELAFPTFVRPHLMAKTAATMQIDPRRAKAITASMEYRKQLRQTLVLGLSDGARTDRFRRANALVMSNEQIWHAYDISHAKAEDLKQMLREDLATLDAKTFDDTKSEVRFSTVVLLDDFTASGTSYIRQNDNESWVGKIPKILQALEDDNDLGALIQSTGVKVIVILYVGAQQAIEYIESRLSQIAFSRGELEFRVVHRLSPSTKLRYPKDAAILDLASKSCYFDPSVNDENAEIGGTSFQLGYAGCQLPVVLSHNTPNNSIYLLWSEDGSDVLGLFPRISRHRKFE